MVRKISERASVFLPTCANSSSSDSHDQIIVHQIRISRCNQRSIRNLSSKPDFEHGRDGCWARAWSLLQPRSSQFWISTHWLSIRQQDITDCLYNDHCRRICIADMLSSQRKDSSMSRTIAAHWFWRRFLFSIVVSQTLTCSIVYFECCMRRLSDC